LRYRISRKVNLILAKFFKVPRKRAQLIAKGVNYALQPFAYRPRKEMAQKLKTTPASPLHIDGTTAFCTTDFAKIPEVAPAIKRARQIYDDARAEESLKKSKGGKSKKEFLVYASQSHQSAGYDELMKLALARPVLDAVASYLGTMPILNCLHIMVSEPNDSAVDSQLYHLDFADVHQVKMFVAMEDVTDDHGPFTFLPCDKTLELIDRTGYDRGRLTIEEVEVAVGAETQISLTCKRGEGVLLDTSKCMHYGSKGNKYPRLMLMIQYTDYYVPEAPPTRWPIEELKQKHALDPVQVMALGG